jgi:low temperature requirement protein LtrA
VTEVTAGDTPEAMRERHATNLELFLDIVFVFAITQIASLIAHEPTATGLGKGVLVAVLVWWQWSQFTWAGSAIDLQAVPLTRALVLCIIPVTLIMTISIPNVFDHTALWFGAAYLGVQLLVLTIQGSVAWGDPATRVAFVKFTSFAVVAPMVVLAGAFVDGNARVVMWCVAASINFIGALRAAGGEWVINSVHFAERHALFIIISLGEVLVASGATASAKGLTLATSIALVAAVAVACVLWWTYFAFIPDVAEHRLRDLQGGDRGRLARDVYTFGHFPLVVGLVLYAVVAKHILQHPRGHLGAHDRWLLALSAVSFLGGLVCIQYRVVRRVAPERIAAMVVICLLCLGGRHARSVTLVALVAVVFGVMQAITVHRFNARRRAEE